MHVFVFGVARTQALFNPPPSPGASGFTFILTFRVEGCYGLKQVAEGLRQGLK